VNIGDKMKKILYDGETIEIKVDKKSIYFKKNGDGDLTIFSDTEDIVVSPVSHNMIKIFLGKARNIFN